MKYKITKKQINCAWKKAKPKIKRARKFSAKRGMEINRDLARPIRINKMTTGI